MIPSSGPPAQVSGCDRRREEVVLSSRTLFSRPSEDGELPHYGGLVLGSALCPAGQHNRPNAGLHVQGARTQAVVEAGPRHSADWPAPQVCSRQ